MAIRPNCPPWIQGPAQAITESPVLVKPIKPVQFVVPTKSILLALSLSVLHAHESPEHTLEALNQHHKLTPAQLHQRAIAHQAMKKYPQAIKDLKTAIARDPKQLGYHLELSRIQMAVGKYHDALHSTEHALPLAITAEQRAELHFLQAEIQQLDRQPQRSLDALAKAFQQIPNGQIEWYLLRSENQRILGQKQQRIDALESGLQHHPSAVLKSHWIDALIDAGEFETALKQVDAELTDRRWRSSYLIKRARALIGLNRKAEGTSDLQSALAEIAPRINPQQPDLLLLAEQVTAYTLLGNQTQAEQSLAQLKAHHPPQWILNRLQEPTAKK